MKKRRGGIKLNRTKKNKNIILLMIASIVAAATAIFGVLKYRGKKTVKDESKKTVNSDEPKDSSVPKDSAALRSSFIPQGNDAPKAQKPSRLEHRKINPGELDWETLAKEKEAEQIRKGEIPEHMLRSAKKPKRGVRRRKWKIAMSGVAMLLAVTVIFYNVVQYMRPAEAMAKESFTGIGKIVEEHGEDNPYKILDIVPSRVEIAASDFGGSTGSGSTTNPDPDNPVLTSFTFTTGTIGYLAGGKVPFADELETAFKGNTIFQHAQNRKELVDLLIPEYSFNTFPGIKYSEAYGGVHNVSKADGWISLFDSQEIAVDENYKNISGIAVTAMTSGGFFGDFASYKDGEEKIGYDFIGLSVKQSAGTTFGLTSRFVYVFNDPDNDGVGTFYAVSLEEFANMPEGTVAFKVVGSSEINSAGGYPGYSDDVDIYTYDENADRYVYEGTVGEVFKDYRYDDGNNSSSNDNSNSGDDNNGNNNSGTSGGDSVSSGGNMGSTEDTGSSGDNTDNSGDNTGNSEDTESTGGVTTMSSDSAMSDISSNTVFTSGWRRLVEGDTPSDNTNTQPDDDTTTIQPDPNTPSTGDSTPSDTVTPGTDTDDTSTETDNPTDTAPSEAETPSGTEEPAEDNNASGTMYYVLSFEPIGADELLALETADDYFEDVTLDEESGGISLFAASPNYESTFIYVGPGKGNYKLTETGNENDKLIGVYNAPIYFKCQTGNDWLRRYVFNSLSGGDNANSSFKIEVTTVRADEVTADMVYEADLVYMESGQNVFLSSGLTPSYIQYAEDDSLPDDMNDMSAGVVSAILSRASDDLMPVIMDYEITEDTDNYADTNFQLLAKALLKRDLADFYEAMNDGANLIANLRMNLGNGSDNDNNRDFPNKYSNSFNYSYVNQNIYVVKNELLVSNDFAEYFDDFKANAGFGDVLAAITAENTTLAEEDRISLRVSKARAIQYIINFSVGIMGEFDDLTILELQPTANIEFGTGKVSSDLHTEVDSKDNTKLYWKTESMKTGKQILYSKKPFSVTTDVKSVVEFNGEWEDINGTYDMIFIGLDGMNLNLGNDKPRRPIYNNSGLNGKVYHSGDSSGSDKYDSNDITSQKMMDLLEYLQAGYPVVVENDCFKDGTARGVSGESINTKYIDEDTWMYRFLTAAVSDERYKDSIFTVSDTMSSALFMARMKTSKPRIELLNEDGSGENQDSESLETSIVQRLVLDENDEYHGKIAYQIRNDRGEEYLGSTVMHLYADMNYDGIFGVDEELTEYVNEGNLIDVAISGMGPGIIPWKLEVTDTGNGYRRHSVQGYFELLSSYEEEVRVLQVTNKKGDRFVDLKEIYNKKEDSMLAYYLRGAEGNANLSFEFESVTPDILSAKLGENDKYLNQWDIVVLTVDDDVAVDNTVFTNYINEGRSLLVCSQSKNGNSVGLTPEMLGWSQGRTFVSLGASNLHRYANLKADMYEVQHGNLKAEKINEGSILYYPYQLNSSSFALGNTESGLRASEYLLDFDGNLKSEETATYVTAWLTLGGNASTAYGLSPRDARNNYYCYSKGNVVYLAQSEYHYVYDAENNEIPDGKEGADECKFFVNALMAAYSAGIHSSDVSIVSGFSQTSAPMKSISVPFDNEWRETADDGTQGILDNTVDVYFKFADSNIGANKKVTVSFYYEDPAGEKVFSVGDKQVKTTQFGSDIYTVTDNKLVPVVANDPQNPDRINVIPGKVYQIKAPVITLRTLSADKANDTTNNAGIYVLVESEFTRNGRSYKIEGFGTVSLNRASLFLLE